MKENPYILDGKLVLITGGGTGIGRAIAQGVVDAGGRVVITGRREQVLAETCRELGDRAAHIVNDITDLPAIPAIILGLFLANVFMCLIGYAGLRLFAKIPSVPMPILLPVVYIFCFVGAFALNNNVDDIYFMIATGVVGYVLIKLGFSAPPLILGLILGSIMEQNLARSLILSNGSPWIFFTRPIACILVLIALLTLLVPSVRWALKTARKRAAKRAGGT